MKTRKFRINAGVFPGDQKSSGQQEAGRTDDTKVMEGQVGVLNLEV